jgi:hypothetical protein
MPIAKHSDVRRSRDEVLKILDALPDRHVEEQPAWHERKKVRLENMQSFRLDLLNPEPPHKTFALSARKFISSIRDTKLLMIGLWRSPRMRAMFA